MLDKEKMNERQDATLNDSKENKKSIQFILKNGVRLDGVVEAFDRYVVVIRQEDDKQAMIYKSAFSTIVS